MTTIVEIILGMFDIRRLKNKCNYPNCNKKPEKEILIYEYTMKRNNDLATLYLCDEHAAAARDLKAKIKNIEPKMIIESKQRSIK
ncbi:MAG: hypothetical protein NT129_04955 [Candidatus Aenigmarchaeota archaeon]|nr:hypothetical protein [Candidatus Aenigmarchaeota archaeon]